MHFFVTQYKVVNFNATASDSHTTKHGVSEKYHVL